MDEEKLLSVSRKQATERICLVSCFSTELLEIHSEEPRMHIVFVPGNPGVISFYKDFVESLYELLDGNASITAICHIAHTRKDWERGRMFSLQDQINHKVDFIKQELQTNGPPLILVGHSIGSYICIEVFKRLPQQVRFAIGLYPFLLTVDSPKLSRIAKLARSSFLSASFSYFVSLLGFFPAWLSRALVKRTIGQSLSSTAIDATCSHLLQYHTWRNVLFMAMTEFAELSEELDWAFMKKQQDQIAFLYGIDDYWAPLSVLEEISRQVPAIELSIEKEGHTHSFCCTEAGSVWVAQFVANLIANRVPN
ncbi:uncharacterized protein A4U43_C02F7180 [Asparagus officinalis]|uniref:Lipid droplet-associated hydrolase n=2 Tax=Asparagus officinalis TaxID=4686 RepID=A0A5P1FGK5_ASPOF|nr:uncharacterized protein A4U43_C02F7180 [Asparagus officinalis]